jgi:hypothetical protein
MNAWRRCPWLLAAALMALSAVRTYAGETAADAAFFEQKIRPVLVEHCYKCHSSEAKKIRGGLRLDSREGLRKGGDRGPAVVPGDPAASLLLQALHYDEPQMPPTGKLPDRVIADFEAWIRRGATDPRTTTATAARPRWIDVEAGKQFWAFQPPRRHSPPAVRQHSWAQSTIDPFVLARLEQAGLMPAPPADTATWLRRVSFDLVGLPPTPQEIATFAADSSPAARARMVDGLLASPHFGERWARPWLDLARFAEDQAHIVGDDRSLCYPNAYLYRDWVIRAFNQDMPYDRFLTLQLAADLVSPGNPADLVALGFLGLGPKYYDRGKPAVMAEEWEDRVDVVTRGLLGLTVACARCHDHKFDPIPTEDYYALAGVFASTEMFNRPLDGKAPVKSEQTDKKKRQDPKDTLHIVRDANPRDLNVFLRGDVNNKGPLVRRHFLSVLCREGAKPFTRGSGRLELAQGIASRDNPLTARVLVNRVWAQCFGQALVGTPSNFGALGERPTHPELLDDLAVRFMDTGWSLKWLLREITLSATYAQAGQSDARAAEVDPDNRLLGRMPRRRLSVEAWRDAVLSAAGRLDAAVGGPSVDPQDPRQRRRTVYSAVSRLELNRILALFDFPDPNTHAAGRVETITPLQKLFVLNGPFLAGQAAALTERLGREIGGSGAEGDRQRIERAYLLLYGRPASAAEMHLGLAFLAAGTPERWRQYAQVLLAANEMLYVD